MILYQYTYLDFESLLSSTGKVFEQEAHTITLIIVGASLMFVLFSLIFPIIIIYLKDRRIQKEKQMKKNLLTEILLKKELEDEIQKEVAIDKNDT